MKDILEVWPESIVFHVRDEGHLGPVMASVLSFMKRMKDILIRGWEGTEKDPRVTTSNCFLEWLQKTKHTGVKKPMPG